jgi:membrane-associated phospholipid phosphatase
LGMPGETLTAQRIATRRLARPAQPGVASALRVAALCALALALVWAVAELVPSAQIRDAVLLHRFTLLNGPHLDTAARTLLKLLDPGVMVCWGLALIFVAIARGLPREALACALVVGLAPLSADRLKPLLAHQHLSAGSTQIGAASWPSGHATAALALALCAVLVTPRRLRLPVAAAGIAFALAVGFALLVQAWHMPSDVVGGYLMAALWMALAVAGLRLAERRWPRGAGRSL